MPGEKTIRHPELRPREVFMGNVEPGPDGKSYRGWDEMRFRKLKKRERLGQHAYDISGNLVEGRVPLFIREKAVR